MNATAQPRKAPPRQARVPDFEEIYRQFKGKVFSTAYRMLSNYADAEDATQDVFVKVFKKLGSFRGEAQLSTWIYRIAVNTCIDFRAKRTRNQTQPLAEEAERVSVPLGLGRLVEGFLPKLPPGYREVFVLHDIQGLKHSEIARVLGITTGASKSQLHRARAFLRRELEPFVDRTYWQSED
ncbi:MAG: RNA polymerase sigma factor [candidate division WOR-3 bacterium]